MRKATRGIDQVANNLARTGKSLTTSLTLPLMAVGGAVVKVGAEFESSMSALGAVTGATGKDFIALKDKAMEMGMGTRYSATEAADAMTELAKAGMNTEQTMAAIPGVLSMAATENMELASAAEIVSAALNSYNLEASDASRVADVLAKNSNMSASGVESLSAALRPVAGFASQVGIEFETLNAVLGILSNNGLDGAVAGQKMNSVLRSMAAPSKKAREEAEKLGLTFFDNTGKMKPFPQIIDEINFATKDMGDQQKMAALKTMFGSDAIAAMLPLLRAGGDEIAGYSDELKDSAGYADEMAAAMNDNLLGALTALSSALETAGIALYESLGPPLKKIVESITKVVTAFANLSPATHKAIVAFGLVVASIGPTLIAVSGLMKAFGKFKFILQAARSADTFGGVLKALVGGPMNLVVIAITAVIAVVIGLIFYWDEIVAATGKFGQALVKLKDWLVGVGKGFLDLAGILGDKVISGFGKAKDKILEFSPVLNEIKNKVSEFSKSFIDGFSGIADKVSQAFSSLASSAGEYFSSIKSTFGSTFSSMGEIISSFFEKFGSVFSGLKSSITDFFSSIGSSISESFGGIEGIFGTVAGFIESYVGKMIGNIMSLVEGFNVLITSGDFTPLINAIANLFPMIIGLFLGGTPGIIYSGMRMISGLAEGMGLSVPELIQKATDIIVNAIEAFSAAAPGFIESGTEMLLNLINGLVSKLPDLINSLTGIINSITESFVVALPQLIEIGMNLLISLITGILTMIPQILLIGVQIITALVTGLVSVISMVLEIGITIMMGLIETIITILPQMLEIGITILTTLVDGIISLLPMIIETGITLLTSLIEGIVSILPSLIDTGITLITSLIDVIIGLLPVIIDTGIKLLTSLIEGIVKVIPTLITAGVTLMTQLIDTLLKALPQLIAAGIQILMALINGIVSIIPKLITTALQLIIAVVTSLIGALPQIISAGVQILMALIKGILQVLPSLISAALQLIAGILKALLGALPQLLSAGVQLIKALIQGIKSLLGSVGSAARSIGNSILDKIKSINLFSVGKDLIKGLWNGIKDMQGWITGKISGFTDGITKSIKGFFGIKSPSRLWRDEIGKMLPQGMVVGMEMEENNLKKASKRLVKVATPDADLGSLSVSQQIYTDHLINYDNDGDKSPAQGPTSQGDINIVIEKFENNTDKDAEQIAYDIAWMTARERSKLE